jgi:hypothetical protein
MNAKQLTDNNGKSIVKGTIVHYEEGWVRVYSVSVGKQTVNVGGIFSGRITKKQVPLGHIFEDEAAWYANWQQSESYKSM